MLGSKLIHVSKWGPRVKAMTWPNDEVIDVAKFASEVETLNILFNDE